MRDTIVPRLMRRLAPSGTRADFLPAPSCWRLPRADEHRKQLMAGFEQAFKGRALPPLPQELAAALAEVRPARRRCCACVSASRRRSPTR